MPTSRLIVIIVVCCLLSSFLAVKFFTAGSVIEAPRETAFERVQRTRTLRCGYIIVQAILRRDEKTGQMSGPAYDIINQIAQNLKLKVEWTTETGPGSVSEDLKNGRFDMLCVPIGTNAARGQVMEISRKVFFTIGNLYVHADETRSADNLSWVNAPDTGLSALDGSVFATLYSQLYPKARIVSLPELSPVSDQILQVATKKADATLMISYDADVFMKHNPGMIKLGSSKPVMIFAQSFWMPKGDFRLKGMIDVALDEIQYNGSLERILTANESDRGKYYLRVRPEYQLMGEGK